MAEPPPVDNVLAVGPFRVYKDGPFKLPPHMLSLLDMIAPHFRNTALLAALESMPTRKRSNRPSLRLIEWLLTIESFNRPLEVQQSGVLLNIHSTYRAVGAVFGHTKETFDPNRRMVNNNMYRIWFTGKNNDQVYSTVAAAHFLLYCVRNGVIKYAVDNHDWISQNMVTAVAARRKVRSAAKVQGRKLGRQSFRTPQLGVQRAAPPASRVQPAK